MKIGVNWSSLKSNVVALGTLLIGVGGVNFVLVQPSLANTVEQFSDAGIIIEPQLQTNLSNEKSWRVILKKTNNNPTFILDNDNILNQPIAEEVHLVVKLQEKRVHVYQGDRVIHSYPIAVGKPGYETPQGSFSIFSKELNPTFKNFKTGAVIPPGRNNPLGSRWIGVWTDGKTQIGFHGTNRPQSIGRAVSHGCIRMYDKDVIELYEKVDIGTFVKVVP